ncbi:MAG: hypothetical protein KAG99_00850, partial [Bacteroidales bacterium]|nr:hypothetical protein [Bacteroidales bacterium]
MSFKFTTFRLLLAFAILPFFTQAEEFFFPWQYSTTASSHVISLSTLGDTPTIDGVPIVPGDWIGLFYSDDCGQHCGGAIQWTGDPTAVTAFGDDNLTTPWVKDGFDIVETFSWKIYSMADGQTYNAVATYQAPGQDIFLPNGFSFVTDLSGASPAWDVRLVMGQVLDDDGAWMENVTVTFDNSGGSAATDEHGYYCIELPAAWTGTATPSKSGYSFAPVDMTYTDILNSPRNQDYVGTFTGTFYTISGTILDDASDPMEGVWVMFNSEAVFTDVNGFYTHDVPEGWNGTVTPDPYAAGFNCYIFSPLSYSYTNVGEEWLNQD